MGEWQPGSCPGTVEADVVAAASQSHRRRSGRPRGCGERAKPGGEGRRGSCRHATNAGEERVGDVPAARREDGLEGREGREIGCLAVGQRPTTRDCIWEATSRRGVAPVLPR